MLMRLKLDCVINSNSCCIQMPGIMKGSQFATLASPE